MPEFYDLSNSPAPYRINYSNPRETLHQFPELDARYNRTHYQNWYEAFLRAKSLTEFAIASGLSGGILGYVYGKFKDMGPNLRGKRGRGGANQLRSPVPSKYHRGDDPAMNICDELEQEAQGSPAAQSCGAEQDTSGKKTKVRVGKLAGVGKSRKSSVASTQMIGASALIAPGEQTAAPLIMKLGKEVMTTDSLSNYYKHLFGRGRVNTEFSGWLQSDNNLRNGTFHAFRHNMANDTAQEANEKYPLSVNILSPIASSAGGVPGLSNVPGVGNPAAVAGVKPVNDANPYVKCGNWDTWFAPCNRSDYEDMSWNLNRLKFNPDTTTTVLPEVGQLALNAHRQRSQIYINNTQQYDPATTAPYKYDMHFKSGVVTYDFCNKGDGALVSNVVVFRVKKNHKAFNNANSYQTVVPAPNTTPYTLTGLGFQILPPYANAHLNQRNARLGTENLQGEVPEGDDVFMSPHLPFIKDSRYMVRGDQTFAEVQRFQFALTSGGRRTLQIKLGGEVYDPSTDQLRDLQDGSGNTFVPETFDQHSYVVCITTQGQLATRAYDTTWAGATATERGAGRLGDMYGPSMLQWAGRYQEKIGACAYKDPGKVNLQVFGTTGTVAGRQTWVPDNILDPDGPGRWVPTEMVANEVAVTMLAQHSAIRDVPNRMQLKTIITSNNGDSTTTETPQDLTQTGNVAKNSDGVFGPKEV